MNLLVKEIRSRQGELHFRRYRLLELPFLRVYIHNICKADEDAHQHTHPWNFLTFIITGGYEEQSGDKVRRFYPGCIGVKTCSESHKVVKLFGNTWTFVVAWGKRRDWGYRLSNKMIAQHKAYREMKQIGLLQSQVFIDSLKR